MRNNGLIPALFASVMILILVHPVLADGSKLAVGDTIVVSVEGEKDFSKPYQLNKDGQIVIPMISPLKIEGLNTTDAAAEITKALASVFVNPKVTVAFAERGKMTVFVVGQVLRRGQVEIGVGDKIIQALSLAGYDDTADLSRINIRRGTEIIALDLTKYLSGDDLSVNKDLESGDTVVVPRSDMVGTVIFLGEVNKVGQFPLNKGMTFREALGTIGGVTVAADTDRITITREGQTEPLKVSYKSAMAADPSTDILLQPGDKIYVPEVETAYYTVTGGVNRPGSYPFKGRVTLTEAVGGQAGGAIINIGDLRYVTIKHALAKGGKIEESQVIDLTKIISGGIDDPIVQRGDIISVKVHKNQVNFWQTIQTILPFGWLLRR